MRCQCGTIIMAEERTFKKNKEDLCTDCNNESNFAEAVEVESYD